MFDGEICMLASDPEPDGEYREWSASRDRFLAGLRDRDSTTVKQGWQKDYTLAAKDTKPQAHEFRVNTSDTTG